MGVFETKYNKYQLINNKTPDGGFNLLGGAQKGSTVYNEAAIRALRSTLNENDDTSLRFYVINFDDYEKIQHSIDEQEPILLENVRFIPVDYTDYLEFCEARAKVMTQINNGEIYFDPEDNFGANYYLFKNYLPKYLGGKPLTAIDLLDSYTKPFGIKTVDVDIKLTPIRKIEWVLSAEYEKVLHNAYEAEASANLNGFVKTSTTLLSPVFINPNIPFNIERDFNYNSGFTFTPEGNHYFYHLPND